MSEVREVTHASRWEVARFCNGWPWAAGVIVPTSHGEQYARIGDMVIRDRYGNCWAVTQ